MCLDVIKYVREVLGNLNIPTSTIRACVVKEKKDGKFNKQPVMNEVLQDVIEEGDLGKPEPKVGRPSMLSDFLLQRVVFTVKRSSARPVWDSHGRVRGDYSFIRRVSTAARCSSLGALTNMVSLATACEVRPFLSKNHQESRFAKQAHLFEVLKRQLAFWIQTHNQTRCYCDVR
jgi:hypothetical protein